MSRCWPKSHANHAAISRGGLIGRQQQLVGDLLETRYQVEKELGSGAFGKVDLVRERATGLLRVIKTVDTSKLSQRLLENMREEIQVLRALDHPNIIRLFEYGEDLENHKIHLLMEACAGGDLDELLDRAGHFAEDLVAQAMRQVLCGIAYCHSRGVVHRDLKPGNVMLTDNYIKNLPPLYVNGCYALAALACTEQTYDCKIIDFGLAKTFDPSDPSSGITDVNGTPAYMAPEVCMRQGKYGAPSDVWSIGVMCYELLTGCLPFGDASDYEGGFRELFEITKQYEDMNSFWNLMPEDHWEDARKLWDKQDTGVQDFVRHLLLRDPVKRSTAEQALQHPWMANYKPSRDGLTGPILKSIKEYAQATHFVKICLLLIAARLNTDVELDRFRHAFLSIDTEGNGSLSMEEFVEAVESLEHLTSCCSAPRRSKMAQWFQQMDLNKDGRLDYSEFLAACLHSALQTYDEDGRGKALASQAFQAIDADGDGLATRRDLEHFFKSDVGTLELESLPEAEFDVRTFHACLRGEDVSWSSSSSDDDEDTSCFCHLGG